MIWGYHYFWKHPYLSINKASHFELPTLHVQLHKKNEIDRTIVHFFTFYRGIFPASNSRCSTHTSHKGGGLIAKDQKRSFCSHIRNNNEKRTKKTYKTNQNNPPGFPPFFRWRWRFYLYSTWAMRSWVPGAQSGWICGSSKHRSIRPRITWQNFHSFWSDVFCFKHTVGGFVQETTTCIKILSHTFSYLYLYSFRDFLKVSKSSASENKRTDILKGKSFSETLSGIFPHQTGLPWRDHQLPWGMGVVYKGNNQLGEAWITNCRQIFPWTKTRCPK